MQILDHKVKISELKTLAEKMYGFLIKGVIDIEKEIVVIDGEMHSDLQEALVAAGSRGINIWGFNIRPDKGEDWLEFDSMVNIKPLLNNLTRGIDDPKTRARAELIIRQIIKLWISP